MPTNEPTSQLSTAPDFPAMELSVLKFWQDTNAFQRSVEMRPENKPYVFYDGPPFATGMPHYGHLLSSTCKDVVPRYWTMKGYRVERIWGWDCHGLPIENMIEKQLDIKGGKKGIEALGIDRFNAACRAEVLRLDSEWEKIIDRLGRWVDFRHNYKTMDLSYMESVWWAFKQLADKNLVYEGRKVILYCPRCATPLSNFEIAMDNSYLDVNEPSTTYKYKVVGQNATYLLAWSTTPWNKLATPALAVNPSLSYVKVRQGGEYYILAESTLALLKDDEAYEVIERFSGAQATELTFEPHYDFFPNRKPDERVGVVVADEFVTADEGTGIVTLAVYGEDDYRVMLREKVQLVEHVDEEGRLKPEVTPWAGMFILKANPLIDQDLQARDLVYRTDPHQHSVATCYRCSTRLYYAPLPAWFINVAKLRDRMIELNEQINWVPEHLKHGRFQKGLENAPDWNISRSRYWGTPMPIWAAQVKDVKTGETTTMRRIVGSLAELREWAVEPERVAELTDIHPEFLTDIELWIDDAKTIKGKRISEVFDCWVESGSMPFAHKHYPFQNKQVFEKSFPGQFISEYIAQTRAWFYTMHVMSTGVFDQVAFENVLTTGTILAEDGTKMSKSKKNYPDPMVLIDKYGVDSLRLYLMSSTVMKSENLNFSEKEVAELRKKVFVIWYNMVSFYKLYTQDLVDLHAQPQTTDIMDRWLMSRLQHVATQVTEYMDAYDVVRASRLLMEFVDELSTWYLRRSRDRLRESEDSRLVFGQALVTLAQLFAPFTPFFTEWVYQTLVDPQASIHHTDWPLIDDEYRDEELEQAMEVLRKVVEKTHAQRKEAGVKVRQPLATLTVEIAAPTPTQSLLEVLMDELNVKAVKWVKSEASEALVNLDTNLSPELKAEGEARELMRSIQKLRKTAGLGLDEQATVSAPSWPEEWQTEIEQKTKSSLIQGATLEIKRSE